jgi:AcrR family transcriptional regulator
VLDAIDKYFTVVYDIYVTVTVPEQEDATHFVEKVGLRERQRQARSSAILQAAFALITERGYEALTMESLAEWLGITRQTLYHHFANKDEIVLRAILTMVAESTKVIEERDRTLPATGRLRQIIRWLLETRFSPIKAQFCKARQSLLPIKSRPEYRAAFDLRAAALQQIVAQAQSDGGIRNDVPSAIVVQMLLSLVTETNYEELISTNGITPDQIVDSVLNTFFHGLIPLRTFNS